MHSSQGSPGHRQDKEEGDARDADHWLLMPKTVALVPKRDFSRLVGRDYVLRDGKALEVSSEEFVAFIVHKKRELSAHVGAKTRGTRVTQSKLKCHVPLVEMTVNTSPWVADCLLAGVSRDPNRVERSLATMAVQMIPEVERLTGCKVLGFTIHFDTGVPHINFTLSKVVADKDGVQRLVAKRGLYLGGPWLCGVDRQRTSGIVYGPHDFKFERALERFRTRYPSRDFPTDIKLCRLFDQLAEKFLGTLNILRNAYRDRIEGARKRVLQTRKEQLVHELSTLDKETRGIGFNQKKDRIYEN